MNPSGALPRRHPIAWFARNKVAANLLLFVLSVGGLIMLPTITQEVFPDVTLDAVTVTVEYRGANPEEVERSVILPIEQAVRGLEGVEQVHSTAMEGMGVVFVELIRGTDRNRLRSEVESEVRRITSFPTEIEQPEITLVASRRQVLSLIYAGDIDEQMLRRLAERARDELILEPDITDVEIANPRPLEVRIEVPREQLRRHRLSLDEIAARVRAASVDLPAGALRTPSEDIVLRTQEQRDDAEDFRDVVLRSERDGSVLRVRDVATVGDGYAEVDRASYFDGKPAVRLDVFRVGPQGPLDISEAVHAFVAEERARLPPTVSLTVWNDTSQIFADRVGLLLRNAYLGLALVLVILGLFLTPRLAFWVTVGIPVAFLGSLLGLPVFDVSINLISLFAFILTLGLVVDDAIVVGESIHVRAEEEGPGEASAIRGALEVARPVVFAIVTTSVAFAPMLFVPGVGGDFFRNIPIVAILVLTASVLEALFVLPAHLAHPMPRPLHFVLRPYFFVTRALRADRFRAWLDRVGDRIYVPAVRKAIAFRYLTLSIALFLLLGSLGLLAGGRVPVSFFPRIEGDEVSAVLRMPSGTPIEVTRRVEAHLAAAARQVAEEAGEPEIVQGIYSEIGRVDAGRSSEPRPPPTGAHLALIRVDLVPTGERELGSREFVARWRERAGHVPGAERLIFEFATGGTARADVSVRLSHPDTRSLERAAAELAENFSGFAGVTDVDEGYDAGRRRVDFELLPEGRALGLTAVDVAGQLRGAFFGAEARRQQRGGNEVRIEVRLPEHERRSIEDLEQMVIVTPGGGEVPFVSVARLAPSEDYTRIERTDLRRTVSVTANVVPGVTTADDIVRAAETRFLPELIARYPGLTFDPGGVQEDQRDTYATLGTGFGIALTVMFAVVAVAFRSYVQPLIVLSAIPFGIVGALLGHLIFGYPLSLASMLGAVALSGVIVNDSLLLVIAVNELRETLPLEESILRGGRRRFRPVLMTSMTTFFGLAPMMFERSVQARFLVPMAISLGFGVLFGTFLLLLVVPALYHVLEDARRGFASGLDRWFGARTFKDNEA